MMNEKCTIVVKSLADRERANEIRFGRTLSNKKINIDTISKNLATKTNNNCLNVTHVLFAHDTVESTFVNQPIKKSLFGYTTDKDTKGFFIHGCVAINASNAEVLGTAGVLPWIREQNFNKDKKNNPSKAIEEKESYKWISVAQQVKRQFTNPKIRTFVADRESDILEYYERVIDHNTHIISRAKADSILFSKEKISEKLASETSFEKTIHLPVTRIRKRARDAKFDIKFCPVEIARSDDKTKSITMYCVQAMEIGPIPEGEERVSWIILTSHPVKTLKKAMRILDWYSWRWVIEDVHRVMKNKDIAIENSQLEPPNSLLTLSILCYATAVKVMLLVKARGGSNQKASDHFIKEEINLLTLMCKRFSGRTLKQQNQYEVHTMGWASWIIARIGGWTCYGHEPGPITMVNGYNEFQTIYAWEQEKASLSL
jgi:hypothetical protein